MSAQAKVTAKLRDAEAQLQRLEEEFRKLGAERASIDKKMATIREEHLMLQGDLRSLKALEGDLKDEPEVSVVNMSDIKKQKVS